MNETINELIARLNQIEERLEEEFARNRAFFHVKLRGRMAEFAEDVVQAQKLFKIRLPQYLVSANFLYILVAPVIYSVIIPIALVDLWVTLYQHVCFRAYGIPRVRRSSYIVFDRHHLAYLNTVEKINCAYCGYGNGVFAYAREVAARTEQFWCPIKHAIRVRDPHQHYLKFVDFGDAQGYRSKLEEFRKDMQKSDS
jgi:hypothetical protein